MSLATLDVLKCCVWKSHNYLPGNGRKAVMDYRLKEFWKDVKVTT
jgi:hypothetical protein